MIITIDGPAGSGKSTAARKLAARLEIAYLDTGAMYRAIAHAAQDRGVGFDDADALLATARKIALEIDCGPTHTRVRVDGRDVSEVIRSINISAKTPLIAGHPAIRKLLVARQRDIGRSLGSCVSEGRDQGSVVFPNAEAKFVLEATLERRAQRRCEELVADGEDVCISDVIDDLRSRDKIDAKQWEPLLGPGRANIIDTTHLSISEVVSRMAAAVAELDTRPGA